MNVPPSPQLRPRPRWTAASLAWVLTASTFGCSTRSLPTTSRMTSSSGFSKILSNREPSAPSASAAAPTKSPLFWPNALLTAVLCNTSGLSLIPLFLIPQYRQVPCAPPRPGQKQITMPTLVVINQRRSQPRGNPRQSYAEGRSRNQPIEHHPLLLEESPAHPDKRQPRRRRHPRPTGPRPLQAGPGRARPVDQHHLGK